jgi:hypothetical protein
MDRVVENTGDLIFTGVPLIILGRRRANEWASKVGNETGRNDR